MAELLRRLIRNQFPSVSVGPNPTICVIAFVQSLPKSICLNIRMFFLNNVSSRHTRSLLMCLPLNLCYLRKLYDSKLYDFFIVRLCLLINMRSYPFDSSVGRAVDCRLKVIIELSIGHWFNFGLKDIYY